MDFLKPIIRDYFILIAFFSLIFIASLMAMIDNHLIRKHQIELQKIEATKCK